LLWVIAAVGVYVDYVVELPWAGLMYDLGDLQVRATKQWNAMGFDRLAGFSRSSVDVAAQLLFFWIVAFGSRPAGLRFLTWCLTGLAIFFTTMKGLMLSWAIIGVAALLLKFRPGKSIVRGLALVLAYVIVGLPLLSGPMMSNQLFQGNIGPLSLYSFGERLRDMWPNQFDTLAQFPLSWLGVGFGYVGVAATLFRGQVLPGDNVFVYLYFIMGVLSVVPVFAVSLGVARLALLEGRNRIFFLLGLAFLVNAVTANVFENAISCFALGCLLGYLMTPTQDEREEASEETSPTQPDEPLPYRQTPI
jgi:hypothetical protein